MMPIIERKGATLFLGQNLWGWEETGLDCLRNCLPLWSTIAYQKRKTKPLPKDIFNGFRILMILRQNARARRALALSTFIAT